MIGTIRTAPFFVLLLGPAVLSATADERPYRLEYSTYFGGSDWEHARDVVADAQGNVFMVGGTASRDFPTTPGAYDRTFNESGRATGKAGDCDVFVVKVSPQGKLLWSTLLGGPNYDRAYAVELDAEGNVCIAGRAGPGFPVTEGAFQTRYGGSGYNGFYGSQNGFVAKLSPDGSRLLWSSFVGVGELCRDLAIDADGDLYLPLGWNTRSHQVEAPAWFKTAFAEALQPKPAGGLDCGVVKIAGDGSRVRWATWLGGSDKDTQEASIRVGADKRPVILCNTKSKDMPTAGDGADRTPHGEEDGFLAKIEADGSALAYGTYLGGSKVEWAISTHNLALDPQGNACVAVWTASKGFPTTPGAWDRSHQGKGDIAVVKVGPDGAIAASTFLGGSAVENADGIEVDRQGRVFLAGETESSDFPVTAGAAQGAFGGNRDAFVVVLSSDLASLEYATLLGGPARDNGRSGCMGPDGSLYFTGATDGRGFPVKAPVQREFAGGGGGWGNGDCILGRFSLLQPSARSR